MRLNAFSNISIFLMKIVALINECTVEFWCSPIYRLVGVQYYKLVFSEMLSTSFCFFSNFTYVAFQLCRLSLIGQEKEHGKLVISVSKRISIKKLALYFAILSVFLSVVKYFRFHVNDTDLIEGKFGSSTDSAEDYPVKLAIVDNISADQDFTIRTEILTFLIFNIVSDVFNYPLFLIVTAWLDMITSVMLSKTLAEKMVTSVQVRDDVEEAVFKSKLMIGLNAAANFFLKLPATFKSTFELYISLKFVSRDLSNEFSQMCLGEYFCELFEKVSDVLCV
jgi:hypothetical protein